MPETQKTATSVHTVLAKYDSSEPMEAGQLKQLIAASVEMIPSDLPRGFALELIDGKLARVISAAIAEERLNWRLLHSHLNEVRELSVPCTPGGTVREYTALLCRQTESGYIAPEYAPSLAHAYSTQMIHYVATHSKMAMCCRITADLQGTRLVEALGGRKKQHFVFDQVPSATSLFLTPLQVVALLDGEQLGHDKWYDGRFHFVIGLAQAEDRPLLISAERANNSWRYGEVVLNDADVLEKGDYLVFGASPFNL